MFVPPPPPTHVLTPQFYFPLELCLYNNDNYLASFIYRAFAHGAMGRRIDPSWGGPIELFLVPASAPRLV